MNRRRTALTAALVVALTVPATASAATAAGSSAPSVVSTADPQDAALLRLRADADGAIRVHRDQDGRVDFLSSVDGDGVLAGSGRPITSFTRQVDTYGEAFGIDGDDSTAVVQETIDSATGTVVRSQQRVDGVPVFGGQVVMSLDDDEDVVSVLAATTDATSVARTVVPVTTARRTALAVTAKAHDVPARSLTATDRGRLLYDPALVHLTDPAGPRPVWEFEVGNGAGVRERVLVGTGRGEVVLHFDDAPSALERRICDNANTRIFYSDAPVPACAVAPERVEGEDPSPVADVNAVYDNIGATHDVYDEVAGIDLTDLIGTEVAGTKSLMSTVRWCVIDDNCPYSNAFWDGTQVVFGDGWGAADDVVAHELTHGYVEKTAGLFSLNQSGALNESLADTIGEIVDHRNAASTESDADWVLGEDLPGVGVARSMSDPTLTDQPDRMTSPKYVTSDLTFGLDGIHENGGVGNKTAYLISQGGDFNTRTLTGIDAGDPSLSKTALLYLEVIPKLTSGSQYADLGRALRSTCAELAADTTTGFTDADCESVGIAVEATELSSRPTDPRASHREAPNSCTVGNRRVEVWRDDDGASVFGFSRGALWHRTPAGETPSYARSGTSSWFGLDPDPNLDGQASSNLTSRSFVVPRSQASYLHFDHAYVFEYYENENGSQGEYLDGGQVLVQTLTRGRWTTRYVPSINGPSRTSPDIAGRIFGGDSRGYGSSRFNLSALGGQTARVVFRVAGDADISYIGWWVDDIRFYTCPDVVASQPRTTVSAGMRGVAVSWTRPTYVGTRPIASYRVTRSRGPARTLPATARRTTFTPVNPNLALTIRVAAVAADSSVGAPATVRVYPTVTRVSSSQARVGRNRPFTVTGTVVRRGAAAAVRGMPVVLQRRAVDQSTWQTVAYGRTGARGTRSWSVSQTGPRVYRVLSRGVATTFGSTSLGLRVRMR